MVTALLEAGAGTMARYGGMMALHWAASAGHADVVQRLLEHGANVDATDYSHNDSRTALHGAAWEGHADVVTRLLEHGADVNAKTKYGSTALDFAEGHADVVRVLREAGAKK